MTTDSPVARRFVAAPDNWSRAGVPIRGISIHMAEGGGTVSWLTRNDGNSSHYVVEYDGDVVQMVREARAAGSMNPKLTRSSNDAPFTYLGEVVRYGRSALDHVLGRYATNPNAAAIAIEVEGYAATGPNRVQRDALRRLVGDIRRRRGALGCLGHRDQQAYKRCPGQRIPWADYGGHAVKTATVSVGGSSGGAAVATVGSSVPEQPTQVVLKPETAGSNKSRWLYRWSDHRADPGNRQLQPIRPLLLVRFVDADTYGVAYEPAAGDANSTSTEMFVKSTDVAKTQPVPIGATAEQIEAAVAIATAEANAEVAAAREREERLIGAADQLVQAIEALESAAAEGGTQP